MDLFENKLVNIDVGTRLRQLRQERGKSLRALARKSGLSTNALSLIERGRTSPSVSSLYKIADALEVPITAFFRLEPPKQEIVFRRAQERRRVNFPKGIWEGLGGESFVGRVEPFMITLEPGGTSGPYGIVHSGDEFVICLQGQIQYDVEGQVFMLNPGDCLIFAAQLRHSWKNIGSTTAQAMFILAGFAADERPSEYHVSSARSVVGHQAENQNVLKK